MGVAVTRPELGRFRVRRGHHHDAGIVVVAELLDVVGRLRAAGCVYAEDEARLLGDAARAPADLAAMVDRRVAGLPLEHILGWAEFCGRRILVDCGVFIPRRRTEFLAEQAIALATARTDTARTATARTGTARTGTACRDTASHAPATAAPIVVDLCCGSGAVGAVLAERVAVELHAVDLDPTAVRCARRNLPADAHVYAGDLYAPLPTRVRGRVDILIANAPYVPTGAIDLMPAEARLHEPAVALDGGPDGLDIVRRVIGAAPVWLAPGGSVLVETSADQAPSAVQALARVGLAARVATSDELGGTVVVGVAR